MEKLRTGAIGERLPGFCAASCVPGCCLGM